MRGNVNGAGTRLESTPEAFRPKNLQDEMLAYDSLDPRIRTLLQQAPVAFCAKEIWIIQQLYGVEATLKQGLETIQNHFPNWTPL